MKLGAHFALLVAIGAAVIAPSLAQNGTVASNAAVNLGMDMFLEFTNGELLSAWCILRVSFSYTVFPPSARS